MKKKILSFLLSAALISQTGMVSKASGGLVDVGQQSTVRNKSLVDFSRKVIPALKWVGGGVLAVAVSCLAYNCFKNPPDNEYSDNESLDKKISDFEIILNRYLEPEIIPPEEVYKVCNEAVPIFKREPALVRISGPTIIVGDIRSDLKKLEFYVRKFLREVRQGKNILLLGDYVSKKDGNPADGSPGVKATVIVFKLKTMFPDKVFLLRGDHDCTCASERCQCEFPRECTRWYPDVGLSKCGEHQIAGIIHRVFDYLPLAAIVGSAFCSHGGISDSFCNDLDNIT
jgi:hypothetical protein